MKKPEEIVRDEEEVWNISDLHRSTECGPSVLDRVEVLCDSPFLSVLITVVESQQRVEVAIPAYAYYSRLETYAMNKNAVLATGRIDYESELQK